MASQHFSMCSGCQETQQIVAVLRIAHTISAPHHACACCPHIHACLLPSSSLGPPSRSPSHASAFQHVMTCRAYGSRAQWRPVISPFDCSVLSWRPFHPGQLKPTTLPLRRLAPDSCSVGLFPTLSLTFSPALSPAPHSLSLSPLCCSSPFLSHCVLLSLSLSLSPSRPKKGGFESFGVSLSPPGFEPSSTGQKRCGVSTGPRRLGICTTCSNLSFFFFFFLTDSRSSKSTQDCAWESGRLQHMIQWIPAKYLHHVLQSFFPTPPCVSSPVMRIFFRMGVCSAVCRGTAQRPRPPGPPA